MIPDWLRAEIRILRRRTWRQRWWCVENWWKGHRFSAVQRCRYCDHTTPYHYDICRLSERAKAMADA